MSNITVQNRITIKRLRNGDTLFISFDNNGVPLYQSIDTNTGVVTPSWDTTHPILTPKVVSAMGNTVSLSSHRWSYDGNSLTFSGTSVVIDGVTYTKATNDARFGMASNGALVIMGNLANADSLSPKTLVYSCVATSVGVQYNLTKSVDIQIQGAWASSYFGIINADTEQLTTTVTSTDVTTHLYVGGEDVDNYYVKWYKDDTLWLGSDGGNAVTITRDDVDGTQLFIAEFYKSSTDSAPIFRSGIRITDTLDDYHVEHRFTSVNREVSPNNGVSLEAYVINVRTNTELTAISGTWVSYIMDKDTWTPIKTFNGTGATNAITVTSAETDRDGQQKDVEIISEVEWTI